MSVTTTSTKNVKREIQNIHHKHKHKQHKHKQQKKK